MLGLLALLVPLATAPLFTFTPPPGFQPDPTLAEAETDALAPPAEGDRDRHLIAYYDDGQGPDAASVSISLVDGPLELEATQRPLLASATAAYFRTGLDLPFELDHTAAVGRGAARRIEVWGKLTLDDQRRIAVVAYFPGSRHHAVVVGSIPEARSAAVAPQLGAALDTFVASDPPEPWARSRSAISLAVWGAAGLVLALVGMRRRRRLESDRSER